MVAKANVYIQGKAFNEITASTFKNFGGGRYNIVKSLEECQIIVFTGGEDISPELYGEKPIPGTFFSRKRDQEDLEALKKALELNKFLVGICRGAQLLNVIPNGGSLWQDVNGHGSCIHPAFDCVTGSWIELNSVHHQMLKITDKAEVICWAQESTVKESEHIKWEHPKRPKGSVVLEKDKDPEAVWYPETQSFLFQGHPEFGHPPTTKYFFGLLFKYFWGKFNEQEIAA